MTNKITIKTLEELDTTNKKSERFANCWDGAYHHFILDREDNKFYLIYNYKGYKSGIENPKMKEITKEQLSPTTLFYLESTSFEEELKKMKACRKITGLSCFEFNSYYNINAFKEEGWN